MPFEVSRSYRTIHSLKDHEVEFVIKQVEHHRPSLFVDYGCHTGHLSFELASRFDMTILSVDNFKGTKGDALMTRTVADLTKGSMDFFPLFVQNMAKASRAYNGFKGQVIPMKTPWFFAAKMVADFIFVDSSHRPEEAEEFVWLDKRLKPGGILGGHDLDTTCPGVTLGISKIVRGYDWIKNDFTFFLKKRSAPQ